MTTVTYAASVPYAGNRPWADVVLNPATPGNPTLKCLVDTGADYLQINALDATTAGLPLAHATPVAVSTVAGTATLQMLQNITVSIEGISPITTDVLIDTTNRTQPLIVGRLLLLAAFDLGFNVQAWLRT